MIEWGNGKRGNERFKGKRKRWKEGEGGGEEEKWAKWNRETGGFYRAFRELFGGEQAI